MMTPNTAASNAAIGTTTQNEKLWVVIK